MSEIAMTDQETADLLKDAPHYVKTAGVKAKQLFQTFVVKTHEGTLTGQPGDYLVQNTVGDSKPWPVKKPIFESTYKLSEHYPARDQREIDPNNPDFWRREVAALCSTLAGDYSGSVQSEVDVALNMAHYYIALEQAIQEHFNVPSWSNPKGTHEGWEHYRKLTDRALQIRQEQWPYSKEEADKLWAKRREARGY